MAACKFSSTLTIKKTDLPVTCKLQSPLDDVTLALVQIFDPAGKPTTLSISDDGLCFTIPDKTAAGTWDLEVRIQGGTFPIPAIHIVEQCDASQRILSITDPVSKMARATQVVQQ